MLIFNPIDGADIVAVSLLFQEGAISESLDKSGVGLLSLKCGLKESKRLKKEQVYRRLERFGSPLVPDISHDFSSIVFQTVSKGFSDYLGILEDLLFEPNFNRDDFKIERNFLVASARSRYEDTFSFGMEKFIQFSFEGTPYQNIPYGVQDSLLNVSFDDVIKRYEDITKSFCIISVAGRITEEIENRIVDFSSLFKKERESLSLSGSPISSTAEKRVLRKGSEQTLILIGFESVSVDHEDYVKFRLLNTILGEGFNSLMFKELREKRGLAYSTGSFLISRRAAGRLVMYILSSPGKESLAEREILSLKDRLYELIDEESISRAKGFIEGMLLIERETRLKRAWYPGWWEMMGRGYRFEEAFIDEINWLSLEEIKELACSFAEKPYHKVVVSGE